MARKTCEAEIKHVGLLNWLSSKQAAVSQANAASAGNVLNVEEQNARHFVDEEETDGGNVQQQKQQQRRDDGHTNACLRDMRKQFDEAKTEQTSLFHVGGLKPVFRKIEHAI